MGRQALLFILLVFVKIGDFVIAAVETSLNYLNELFVKASKIKSPFWNYFFDSPKYPIRKGGIKRSKTLYRAPHSYSFKNLKQRLLSFKSYAAQRSIYLKSKAKQYLVLLYHNNKVFSKWAWLSFKLSLIRLLAFIKLILQKLVLLFKFVFTAFLGLLKAVISGLFFIITTPFVYAANMVQARRVKRHKNINKLRTSFLYKLKYLLLGIVLSFFFLFIPIIVAIFIADLPNPNNLSVNFIPKTTKIYDRNNTLLYEIYANQNRTVIKLNEVPVHLKNATIAIEDKDFYTHPGFDLRGIIRALVSNLQKNDLQGGSTITQQLIKSAFLTPTPSINRKIREVVLAFWSERIYSKGEILEMYFNYVPYGGTAWGVESASEIYFGKKVKDLTLAQSAFLAGLPRAPSIYSPFAGNSNAWKKRQSEVLSAMVRDGYISAKVAKIAQDEKLEFKSPKTSIKAPHFVMYVKDMLVQKYGLNEVERGGLQVKTTLDLGLQESTENTVKTHVEQNEYLNVQNGAALIINPQNGDILSMVGSRDYFDIAHDGNVNVVTSQRQPGSTIKIVTYSLALESGFTEATILEDSPLTIVPIDGSPTYSPVNYDGTYHGKIPLRIAFANSYNVPAVRVAQKVGVDNIVKMGQKMGITTWKDPRRYGLSITLGGGEVKMIDLVSVYATIANQGQKIGIDPILEVRDSNGKALYKKTPVPNMVINSGIAFIISDILADNNARSLAFGANSPLNIPGHRVSVKTGTTDNKRDNWTVGFTNDYVVATWVGNNDNSPMSPSLTSGITGAAPMWNSIMTSLLENKQDQSIEIPENIISKNCNGRNIYLVVGTESSVNCRSFPSPLPTSFFR